MRQVTTIFVLLFFIACGDGSADQPDAGMFRQTLEYSARDSCVTNEVSTSFVVASWCAENAVVSDGGITAINESGSGGTLDGLLVDANGVYVVDARSIAFIDDNSFFHEIEIQINRQSTGWETLSVGTSPWMVAGHHSIAASVTQYTDMTAGDKVRARVRASSTFGTLTMSVLNSISATRVGDLE